MSSFTAPVSLYNLCSETKYVVAPYRPQSVMAYVHHLSPLYAFIIQKAGATPLFEACEFGTCCIPNRMYSVEHLRYFMEKLNIESARNILRATILPGRTSVDQLSQKEDIPTISKYRVKIDLTEKDILLNGILVEKEVTADNGVILVMAGLIRPGHFE